MVGPSVEHVSRRGFVRGSLVAAAVTGSTVGAAREAAGGPRPAPTSSHWLGRDWWGNRLQDWLLRNDRIICVATPGQRQGRTVSALTYEVVRPRFVLRVRTGTYTEGPGFSGFVVGTGRQGDDWRARVLVGAASGTGGGFLATYESDGTVRFREHTDEVDQMAYAEIPSVRRRYSRRPRRRGEQVILELSVQPAPGGTALAQLRALDAASGTVLATAQMLTPMPRDAVLGGVGLVSSGDGGTGARYWFSDFVARGHGIARLPERGLGPIVGTLFSVSEGVLKMTAQLMPVDTDVVRKAWLQVRRGGVWQTVAARRVGPTYAVTFRVPNWDGSRPYRYRVIAAGFPRDVWTGRVPAEPRDRELVMASLSCVKATHRPLDRPSDGLPRLAGEAPLGLYTQENVWFPHDRLAASIAAQEPDLLVAHGDQLYEHSPTIKDPRRLRLDFLGKYLLWLWSFRDVTRSVPTVVLADDHDVFQPNLWGAGGIECLERDSRYGGYLYAPDWVNVVQETLCGHNPDPYDATPVERGIGVYYGGFVYGGVSFAVLEDRKFKPGPDSFRDNDDDLTLLGARQEQFLQAWAADRPELPKVALTQTLFAAVQTEEDGTALLDPDSNGWPQAGRDRALRLLGDARALVVSGDQHLGLLVRHGFRDSGTLDGPLQFAAPAGSSSYQRWFEPGDLARGRNTPYTGEWADAFANPLEVLAVVQPSISKADFRVGYPGQNSFGDRALKNEGYGIVRVDPGAQQFTIECWRWDVDPTAPDAAQFPGFPHRVGFAEV